MNEKDFTATFTFASGESETLTAEKLLETFQRVSKDCPPLTPIVLDPHVRFVDGELRIVYELRPERKPEGVMGMAEEARNIDCSRRLDKKIYRSEVTDEGNGVLRWTCPKCGRSMLYKDLPLVVIDDTRKEA